MSKAYGDAKNVLRFEQNAEFFFAKYQRLADQGVFIDALVALRTAFDKSPDNSEYKLALAELYTELGSFEESNLLLFDLMREAPGYRDSCLFGLGCNFFGMRDIDKAKESFENYLVLFPMGEFSNEVRDFLEMIELELYDDEGITLEIYERADLGKDLLDNGQYAEAIEVLENIVSKDPTIDFVKNNLALAYYCNNNLNRAVQLSEEVLKQDNTNAHAICNLILFALSDGDDPALENYSRMLDRIQGQDADEMIKIALTYCELGRDDKAYGMFREVLAEMPYDTKCIFFAGVAAANTGSYLEALDYFMDLLKLNPEDTVAYYFKNKVQAAIDKDRNLGRISYQYQVPSDEIRNRMRYLNICFSKEVPQLKKMWETDVYFRGILYWSLEIGSDYVRRAVVDLIAEIGGQVAEDYFKAYILKKTKPDDIKDDIFLAMKRMGMPQPYVAYIGGKVSEVRIGTVDVKEDHFNPSNEKVMHLMIDTMQLLGLKKYIPGALEVMQAYLNRFEAPPIMRNRTAWAAAFIYRELREAKETFELSDILNLMEVSEASFTRCLKLIDARMQEVHK